MKKKKIERKGKKGTGRGFLSGVHPFLLFILFVNLLLYIPSINSGYLLDDKHIIVEDYRITNPVHLPSFFPFERPARAFTLMVDYYMHGYNPRWFHFTNIVLHLLVILLLWRVLILFNFTPLKSFLAILLFSLHPFSMDAVYIITHRKESLFLIFLLINVLSFKDDYSYSFWIGTIYLFFLFIVTHRILSLVLLVILVISYMLKGVRRYVFFSVSYLLAILSKETAGLFPFAFYPISKDKKSKLLSFIPIIPIIIGLFFINRVRILSIKEFFYAVFVNFPAYVYLYFKNFIFPFKLFSMTPYIVHSSLSVIAGYLILIFLVYLGYKLWEKYKFYVLWIVLIFLPVSGLIPVRVSFGIRYLYAILPPLFIIIADSLFEKHRKWIYFIAFYFFIGFIFNIHFYTSEKNFYRRECRNNPNPVAFNNLAMIYFNEGNYDMARQYYEKAILLDKSYYKPYNNLGIIYEKEKEYRKAAEYFKMAAHFNPEIPQLYYNVGIMYYKMGEIDSAITYYKRSLDIEPNYTSALKNLTLIYLKRNRTDTLEVLARKLLTVAPSEYWAYDIMAYFYKNRGDMENYKKCLKIKRFYEEKYRKHQNMKLPKLCWE